MDNSQAAFTGSWSFSTNSQDKYSADYHFATTVTGATATATATFTPEIAAPGKYDIYVWYPQPGTNDIAWAKTGKYEIYVWYPQTGDLANDANYFISFDGGTQTVLVNQTNSGGWQLIASGIDFLAGTTGFIRVSNLSSVESKVVMADAVRLVPSIPDQPPVITSQPTSRTNNIGTTAEFSVIADGTAPLNYQWRKDGVGLSNGGNVSGAQTPTLTLSNVGLSDASNYSVVITNMAGSVTSSVAVLTVLVSSDFSPPSVSITSPKNNAKVFVPQVSLAGTAKDLGGVVVDVKYRLLPEMNFSSAVLSSSGTQTNWTTPSLALSPGSNIVHAYSIDGGGNVSPMKTNVFFFDVFSPLTVQVAGNGQVKSSTLLNITNNHQMSLLVGRPFALTAFIGKGTNFVFTNWTAGTNVGSLSEVSTNLVYKFLMESNLILRANFITNPFTPVAGSYAGLFMASNGVVEHRNAGFFTVKVTEKASFSSKLIFDGDTLSGSGKFNLSGQGSRTIVRAKKGKADVNLFLELDWGTGSQEIRGTLSDGNWVSELVGDRAVFGPANLATQFVGSSTFLLTRPNHFPVNAPGGYGYGIVTNTPLGVVKMTPGAVGDGAKAVQSVSLSKDGRWPLYAQFYKTTNVVTNLVTMQPVLNTANFRGSLMGWVTFTNGAPVGELSWVKTGEATNYLYPAGFTSVVELVSSRYQMPAVGMRGMAIANGTITLSHGNLSGPIAYGVTWATNNAVKVVTAGLVKPTFSFTSKSGLFKGTFPHPQMGNVKVNFTGAALQEQNYIGGVFLGTDQSGSFLLQSAD